MRNSTKVENVEKVETTRVCPVCGTSFSSNHPFKKYCSKKCSTRAFHLKENPDSPNYSAQTLLWLEVRTFENMVYFFAEELERIRRTGKRPPGTSDGTHRLMLRTGILTRCKGSRGNTIFFKVSPRALKELKKLKSQELTKLTQKMPARALENAQSGRTVPIQASSTEEGENVE